MARLNKDEKRRLEKLAIREISDARSLFNSTEKKRLESLVKKLNAKIPSGIKARFKKLQELNKQVDVIEKWFAKSEYNDVSAQEPNWNNDHVAQPARVEVRAGYGDGVHSDVRSFNVDNAKREKMFSELEKNFSIGLLDSEDAIELFAQLQKDLSNI